MALLRSDSHFGMLGVRSSLYEHKTCHPGTTRTLLSCSSQWPPSPHAGTMPTAPYLFDVDLLWFGLRGVLCPIPDYIGTPEVAQAVLDVTVILFQLPECWDYRCELPCLEKHSGVSHRSPSRYRTMRTRKTLLIPFIKGEKIMHVCHTSSLFFSAWDCPSYAIAMFYHWTTSQPLHVPLWLKDQCLLKKTSNQTKERKQFTDFSNDEFRADAL